MKSFRGKQVLITGAGSGIGRATARAFANEGASLWLVDVNDVGNMETADHVRGNAAAVRTVHCDVRDFDAVRLLADEVHAQVPALDVLVNNAGIGSGGRFLDTRLETWKRVLDVNLMGVVHGCYAFLPKMVEQGSGHVVNLSSVAGFAASPDMPVYTASKFAVLGLSESLREDMRPHGVGVTAICPGVISTPIIESSILEGGFAESKTRASIIDFYKKRSYPPERVASAILKAVRSNQAIRPVSPESWIAYYGRRIASRDDATLACQVCDVHHEVSRRKPRCSQVILT